MPMRNYRNLPGGTVDRARELRRNASDAEKALWRALRGRPVGTKWRWQVPFGPYYADFVCVAARLIVERRAYDARRTRFLNAQGYRVIRFWNNDVLRNLEGGMETILLSLSHWEREGGAKRREGEGDQASSAQASPSPSHAAPRRGPLPLPEGEGLGDHDPPFSSSNSSAAFAPVVLRRTLSPSTPATTPIEI